ncbi:Plasmodium exported protein, unknown function [Plasmodium sp. gorilla clade G2]|uniref:Plasmodium exported protein, unknown function n=1 Tax=Plasmodium sp. gorilla clade G2 TaxID=880535 RepID=UPI000D2E0CBD|nr:Plasmodium exported protein, unknown function [Plasmodium sp. gorilla clade G2]SOV20301.1 Plasmodium exported protein, unknown function [Plasmodium sp. gorilla clade G2]
MVNIHLYLHTTNIPRTNNVSPKNVAINISPVGPIPDVITLDYIKENLEQIQLMKDLIIKEKLKKLKLLKKNEELRIAKLKDNIFKIYQFILYLIPNTIYYTIEFINNIPEIELSPPKIFKMKKRKSKSFLELWSSLYEILEERVHKYQIGGYVFGFGLLAGIGKSIHSIVATPAVCIKYAAAFSKFSAAVCKSSTTLQVSSGAIATSANSMKFYEKLKLLEAACTAASASPDPATKVVAAIIIVILVIILLVFLYYVIKKSGILENEHVQKVIVPIQKFFDKYITKMKYYFKDVIYYISH